MFETKEISTAKVDVSVSKPQATKDAGRVHIGGAAMHFGEVTPSREATKDSGRVQLGGAAIHF